MKLTNDGFPSVRPYCIVEGGEHFIAFLVRSFDAEEMKRHLTPSGDKIMHAEIRIGDSLIAASDASEACQQAPNTIHLYVRDTDDCYRRALEAGARSLNPPADKEYGERSAGIVDPFGNTWFLATPLGPRSE
ncbi:VOC family protein [Paenibacillus doosanensis]|uniref:Glyoxalase-like domain protein n=1 Tax=Paenibacillus konkukensis TaxID=2020716 RepID=A0ABY4RYE3_9BACL|nr:MULTISPECIES: VOC family protein [Paenibacillus]MCS7460385.1 VOC family protein [Paenibacillus doosanensis]UQZ87435.1 Glyoxalase-like domain protein [Paenibacillus konkukensis]